MLEIKIIIFDFDDMLLDSKKVIVNSVNHALSKLGMELTIKSKLEELCWNIY